MNKNDVGLLSRPGWPLRQLRFSPSTLHVVLLEVLLDSRPLYYSKMVWKQFFCHQTLQSKDRGSFEKSDGKVMQIRAKLLKFTPLPHLEIVQKNHLIWYLKAPNTKTNCSHILSGQVRRWLSLEGVRGQARCLLGRVGALGPGAVAAAKRRGWALQEEARMSRERNAHQLCLAQGHYSLRRGQFQL